MKISSINSQFKTNSYRQHFGDRKSDWKIQKLEDGVFVPQKRYRVERTCEIIFYILLGIDLIISLTRFKLGNLK